MIRFRVFRPDDLLRLGPLQGGQAWEAERLLEHYRAWVAGGRGALAGNPAWSAVRAGSGDPRLWPVLGCSGFLDRGPDGAECWAYVSDRTEPLEWVALHRYVAARVAERPGILSMYVSDGFAEGRRWAELLGFNFKATLTGYPSRDRNTLLFVRDNARSAGGQGAALRGDPRGGAGLRAGDSGARARAPGADRL